MSPMLLLLACVADDPKDSSGPTGGGGDSPAPLHLGSGLTDAVADNDGYGGGILRAEEPAGVRYLGADGTRTIDGAAMTTEDEFEIASITKTFTATMILLLVEDHALSLDDTLADALPAWSTDLLVIDGDDLTPTITIRQLLNHTSGLPDYWSDPPFVQGGNNAFLRDFIDDPDHFWTPEEILSYVPELNPIDRPGQTWHYSDTNYVLLGLIVEELHNKPLHDAMRDTLFDPLGLDQTWMSFREDRPYPESHRYEGTWDMTTKTHQSADWAGGGLVSTAEDLHDFLRALSSGEVFAKASTLTTMTTSVPTGYRDISYGLGVFIVQLDDGRLWGHDGYGNSFMYLHTSDDTIFTGTLNQTENDWWSMVEAGL